MFLYVTQNPVSPNLDDVTKTVHFFVLSLFFDESQFFIKENFLLFQAEPTDPEGDEEQESDDVNDLTEADRAAAQAKLILSF